MFVSLNSPTPSDDIHKTLRNGDGTINLGDFLKLKQDSPFMGMGLDNTPLGANLNKSDYNYSVDEIINLIDEIGTVTYSSESYQKVYRCAKAVYKLSNENQAKVLNLQKLVESVNAYNELANN